MNYVVDDIGSVIAAMRTVIDGAPFFEPGPSLEVTRQLLIKNLNPDKQNSKYPLFILAMPFDEDNKGKALRLNLNIAIVAFTDYNYSMADRYQNVFKPTLYPLYELFFAELRKSGKFMWPGIGGKPNHIKRDLPLWGTTFSKDRTVDENKSMFEDPLDAIEILNLEINQTIKC